MSSVGRRVERCAQLRLSKVLSKVPSLRLRVDGWSRARATNLIILPFPPWWSDVDPNKQADVGRVKEPNLTTVVTMVGSSARRDPDNGLLAACSDSSFTTFLKGLSLSLPLKSILAYSVLGPWLINANGQRWQQRIYCIRVH